MVVRAVVVNSADTPGFHRRRSGFDARRPLVDTSPSMADAADRLGRRAFNAEDRVRGPDRSPDPCSSTDRVRRYERRDRGSTPRRGAQKPSQVTCVGRVAVRGDHGRVAVLAHVAQRSRHRVVSAGDAGSTPVVSAPTGTTTRIQPAVRAGPRGCEGDGNPPGLGPGHTAFDSRASDHLAGDAPVAGAGSPHGAFVQRYGHRALIPEARVRLPYALRVSRLSGVAGGAPG